MMKIKLTPAKLLLLLLIILGLGMCCGAAVVEGLRNQKEKNEDEDTEADHDDVNLRETAKMANPKGIPKSEIPEGEEDLYILKSQVVPPVCPACPVSATVPREKPCPPCPPCARCPEPAFECKKVPNYDSSSAAQFLPSTPFMAKSDSDATSGYISRSQTQPRPMLTSFSSF